MTTATKFKVGDIVKIHNGTETFRVTCVDGDVVTCWGGSKDPNAYRSYRSFYAKDIVPETRKLMLKVWAKDED